MHRKEKNGESYEISNNMISSLNSFFILINILLISSGSDVISIFGGDSLSSHVSMMAFRSQSSNKAPLIACSYELCDATQLDVA